MPAADKTGGFSSVACERLPATLRVEGAKTCTCLGRLDTADLLWMTLEAARRPVALVDPGFCATCPEGGEIEPPGASARAEAAALLAQMGRLAACMPALQRAPPHRLPRDDTAPRHRAKRAFLRRLVRPGEPTAGSPGDDQTARRAATLAALRRLAEAFEAPLPPRFFPAITVSSACRDHGVCAALCGPRALRRYEDEGTRGIAFDAALCTACGACESGCPERAIELRREGDGRLPSGKTRLTAHRLRSCERCEDEFAAEGEEGLCPTCRKDMALFADESMARRTGRPELQRMDFTGDPR
jgi:Pyruvate/2-oxoacid:ferredoxin oxidoreductase delta subunit